MAALQAETGQRADLDLLVTAVEQRLGALTDALRDRNAPSIELHATELHRDLARAVEAFMHAARHGGVPDPMRLRLATAGAQVARQREALARATAALDRAIDVLMPAPAGQASVYGASGRAESLLRGGSLSA
ncbi:hypothetical protein [Aquabacterium sp. OR-4]|uniref:hypothetical protein n=1 Tax=Aquabacterium sp. OR-4 TaxID=2978127 RepID=UPI0021B4BFA4|nr:hypothetical protein [Aquabacterium sp. OR-4]MDT7836198.1 hypothetical protein [Aquabacterium sp. OR-4]